MSSTATAKFIRGHTLYLFPCFGCFFVFTLARGKSLIAGFLSFMSDLNLKTASSSLNPFLPLSSILFQNSRFSFAGFFLQGQFYFFSMNFLNFSLGQVQTYT